MKFFPLLFLVFLQNCSIPAQEDVSLTPMLINSYKVSCQGFIPQQCLLVKEGEAIEMMNGAIFMILLKALTMSRVISMRLTSKKSNAILSRKM